MILWTNAPRQLDLRRETVELLTTVDRYGGTVRRVDVARGDPQEGKLALIQVRAYERRKFWAATEGDMRRGVGAGRKP